MCQLFYRELFYFAIGILFAIMVLPHVRDSLPRMSQQLACQTINDYIYNYEDIPLGLGNALSSLCQTQSSAIAIPDIKQLMEAEEVTYTKIVKQLRTRKIQPSIGLKETQLAVSDLKAVVKNSKLQYADTLSSLLDKHVGSLRDTAEMLAKFESRVESSIAKLIAIKEMAVQDLKEAKTEGNWEKIVNACKRLFDAIEHYLRKDVMLAHNVSSALKGLEDQMETITDFMIKEENIQRENLEELLSTLWVKLGFSKAEVSKYQRNLSLLSNMHKTRKEAMIMVSITAVELERLQQKLDTLREDASAITMADDTMLELHMQILQAGIDNLVSIRDNSQSKIESKSSTERREKEL